MSVTEKRTDTRGFDILDHNTASGYVTYIVDIWKGDRFDPAVEVERYIGVWKEEWLEDAADPDFKDCRYGGPDRPRRAMAWERLESVKEGTHDARMASNDHKRLMDEGGASWGTTAREKELYQGFMEAIEVLAADDSDDEAWAAIDAWRKYNAHKHEK